MVVGGVFLVDPQAFQRHRSSQTQRGWRWQTWSDTAEVLRKRPSPELPSTHTNTGWQQRFTRTNLWFFLLALPTLRPNELCCLCTEDNTPARSTRWLHSTWIWGGKKIIKGNYPEEEITKTVCWPSLLKAEKIWIDAYCQVDSHCFMLDMKQG